MCNDVLYSVAPNCEQGEALVDGTDQYAQCGTSSTSSAVCGTNYQCYFDGYVYGCCPVKCKPSLALAADSDS